MELRQWSEEELLTACLYAEARGEPYPSGMQGVCNVILHRVQKKMGKSIAEVILKKNQFSWTNPQDVNYQKVLDARETDRAMWERAHSLAMIALAHGLKDNVAGADHYLNVEVTKALRGGTLPKWAKDGINQGKVTVVIGQHTFLNLLG